MRKFIISAIFYGIGFAVLAQDTYYVDALRYSNTLATGSARIQAVGGAGVAMGADLGAIYANPASLGFYRKSEVGLSLNFMNSNTTNTYLSNSALTGTNGPTNMLNINVPNFGVAIFLGKSEVSEGKWRGGTLAFSQTRIANFQNNFNYSGENATNSLLTNVVNGLNSSSFNFAGFNRNNITSLTDLAWFSFLIDRAPVIQNNDFVYDADGKIIYYNNRYTGLWPADLTSLKQQESVRTQGSMSEWNISYGGNYDNKVYVGGSIGIVGLRYNQVKSYQEISNAPQSPGINSLTYNNELNVFGTGINGTIGVNIRPIDFLRIGLSFKTPSYIGITENETKSLQAQINNFGINQASGYDMSTFLGSTSATALERKFSYNLATPYRAKAGIVAVLDKYGFISTEVEYLNYGTNYLSANTNSVQFLNANNSINSIFAEGFNFKGGLEFRWDIFRVRGGYSWYASPYQDNTADYIRRVRNGDCTNASGGLGIRTKDFYLDGTLVITSFSSTYSPYILGNNSQPTVLVKNNFVNFILSSGFFF